LIKALFLKCIIDLLQVFNEVSEQNSAIDDAPEEKLANGYSNGDKNQPTSGYTNGYKRIYSGYRNGEKKKSVLRRLSLHR
jgi:hypothetical protein